jgi:quercetin dioxygenase-like cupin family protein
MFVKIFCVLILAPFLGGNASFAQDPLKVESAHYKLAFENERVQVINIHYGPHEKSNMHQHPGGVVVNLTNGHLRFTDQKGVVQEVRAIHGEARWFPALKHKVENLSDVSYDAVYIAVKSASTAVSSKGQPALGGSTEDGSIEKVLLPLLLAEGTSRDSQTHQELRSSLSVKPVLQSKSIPHKQNASAYLR